MARLTAAEREDALDVLSRGGTVEGFRQHEQPLTVTEAAKRFGITRNTIYMWAHRGLIEPVGWIGRRKLYRLGDLLELERATRRSGHSRRRRVVSAEAGAHSGEAGGGSSA